MLRDVLMALRAEEGAVVALKCPIRAAANRIWAMLNDDQIRRVQLTWETEA